MVNVFLKENVLWSIAGFGIGGALWGVEAYRGTVGSGETFTNPFSYILGAMAMAVFGGFALAYITQNKSAGSTSVPLSRLFIAGQTWKIIGVGLLGWLAAFFVPAVWAYQFWLAGNILIVVPELLFSGDTVDKFLSLAPSLGIGYFWLEFLIVGAIVALIYAMLLKSNVKKVTLYGAIGFAIASLIGPILGNVIDNLFNSLFISYLVTFLIIGKIFGFALGRALR